MKPLIDWLASTASAFPNVATLVTGNIVAVPLQSPHNLPLGLIAGTVASSAQLIVPRETSERVHQDLKLWAVSPNPFHVEHRTALPDLFHRPSGYRIAPGMPKALKLVLRLVTTNC